MFELYKVYLSHSGNCCKIPLSWRGVSFWLEKDRHGWKASAMFPRHLMRNSRTSGRSISCRLSEETLTFLSFRKLVDTFVLNMQEILL